MRTSVLALCVLLQATLPLGLRTDRVLCIGANGHVEVEPVDQPCCRAIDAGCACCEDEEASATCPTCTDIPVTRLDDDPEVGILPVADLPMPVEIVLPPDFRPADPHLHRESAAVCESPPLAALRTVVLLA
jgi:hypothetical protein